LFVLIWTFPSISRPTRVLKTHASLIDNIFVSDPFLASSGIICTDISDHFPIFACLKSIASLQSLHTADITSITRSITSSSVASLQRYLQSQSWDFITEYSNANDDYDCFSNVLAHAIHKCLPTKRITTHNSSTAAWLTPAQKTLVLPKRKCILLLYVIMLYGIDYKEYRNKLTSLIRVRKKQYYSEFIVNTKVILVLCGN
jgi:IS1 family transposase